MTTAALEWHKPAAKGRFCRNDHDFARVLEKVPKAAKRLCEYLFTECIGGRFEWIHLYSLPIGDNRDGKSEGKTYSRPTLRNGLRTLEKLGLVVIDAVHKGGMYHVAIVHVGEKRPFDGWKRRNPDEKKSLPNGNEIFHSPPRNPHPAVSLTEEYSEKHVTESAEISAPAPTPPPADRIAPASHGKGQGASPCSAPLRTLDREPLPAPEEECGEESAEEFSLSPSDSSRDKREILSFVRGVVPLTPKLVRAVTDFTMRQVMQAVEVLREQKDKVRRPDAFLLKALKGGWKPRKKPETYEYPPELVEWHSWAVSQGIVDDRPLHHLPLSAGGNPQGFKDAVLVRVLVPIPAPAAPGAVGGLLPWREAAALFPLPSLCPPDEEPSRCGATPDAPLVSPVPCTPHDEAPLAAPSAPAADTPEDPPLAPGSLCRAVLPHWGLSLDPKHLCRIVRMIRGAADVRNHRGILIEGVPLSRLAPAPPPENPFVAWCLE